MDQPLDVLVVASWFPAIDDSTKGRFVSDQVEALRATGRVSPWIASFEPVGVGGGPIFRRRQVRAIERNVGPVIRDDPGLFNPSGSHSASGIPVARVPIAGGGWGAGGTAHGSLHRDHALRRVADRRDLPPWAIVHAHTGYPDGAGSIGLASRLGVPLVVTEHATFVARIMADPWQRSAYRASVRAAARFVAVSRTLGDELIAAIPEVEAKLVVIPNTVDVAAFSAAPDVERRPEELLYVGYRTPVKAIDVLLTAFREIHAARPGATLRLIGASPSEDMEAGWLRLAGELGIAGSVSFEGPALRADVARAMARASLLVHPSRRETFGVAAVEALAAGLPVIAGDTGPLREILGDGPDLGALVPVGDAPAFAAAVLRALDRRASFDPVLLRASVVDRFGAPAVANRLADLYRELAESRPRTARPAAVPAMPTSPAAGGPILVIGLATTSTARLLKPLPASVLSRCRVLCAAGDALAELPAGLGATITVDLEGPDYPAVLAARSGGPRGSRRTRVLRVIRDPLGYIGRRRLRARWDSFRAETSRRAVEAELANLGAASPVRPIEVVALDGLDHAALGAALKGPHGADIRLLPGGVRWLADRAEHAS